MKLKAIHCDMQINTSRERMWEILSHYGDVDRFHAGVMKSVSEAGSGDKAAPGCERVCNIVDMGLRIMLKERIVDYVEGESYKYEVYEWKNFPLRRMYFGFRIIDGGAGYTTLGIDIEYRARPAFLTPLMAWKMRKLAHDVLLGYKHYAETGEQRVPIKALKKRYKSQQFAAQYG